ncbi:MAG: LacI family DNA-binding transcriptional regulator [Ruminiclostridium sp.]|nr:LacI family DNA-binding transcriptional regulator [Ruminiclostridium sp.]
MIKKTVTMSDIAAELGCSTVTVSKALSDKDGVSDELRQRIKQKANEMGYRVSYVSKNSKEALTYHIGVLVAQRFISDASAFYWVVYRYIVELLQNQSYYGILEVITEKDERAGLMPNSITEKKIDGIIALGQFSDTYVENILSAQIPIVFLDFYSSRLDVETVLSDNFFGSYSITNYLINNGHRRIGFIGTITATSSIQDRYMGYYKSLLEHGIPLRDDWVIDDRDSEGVNFKSIRFPDEMPTAFVCNCDDTAYQVVNQLKSMGYRIPNDISIVGYDNHIYSTISNPRITTKDINSYHMSSEAVEILVRKIRDNNYHCGRILVTGKLLERDSVKNLKENKDY